MANLTPQELAELQRQAFENAPHPASGTPTIAPFDPSVGAANRPAALPEPGANYTGAGSIFADTPTSGTGARISPPSGGGGPRLLTDAEVAQLFATVNGPSALSSSEQRSLLQDLLGRQPTTADTVTITTDAIRTTPTASAPGAFPPLGHGGGTAPLPAGPTNPQADDGRQTAPPSPALDVASEDQDAVLARLRAERDADNARSLAQSDVNRTGWLAQVEAILARLRTPTERAKAYGAALFAYLAAYFRALVGHEPWAWTAMGRVLRVDRATKTCRVQIAADVLNPSAVPDQRKVSYGFAAPRVGQTVPVHFPTRVTRSGPLEAEPDPEHLPWCKVPGGAQWWLYLHQNPFTLPLNAPHPIVRVQWPITTESVVEPVAGLTIYPLGSGPSNAGNLYLFGYHTGTRRLYALNSPWLVDRRHSADAPANATAWLVACEDWGFGAQALRDTTRLLDIGGVADSLDADPTHVHLSALEPVSTHFVHDDFAPIFAGAIPPGGANVDTSYRVLVSTDGGAHWATQATREYLRPVIEADFGVGYELPAQWPGVVLPFQNYGNQGFTTVADGVFGPAGALVLPIQAAQMNPVLTVAEPDIHQANVYDIQLWAYYDGTWAPLTSFAPPAQALDLDHVDTVWLRQTDDGAFRLHARFVAGTPVYVPAVGGWEAPRQWYRGEGTLGSDVTWTPIGVPTPGDFNLPVTTLAPDKLLAVSPDGLSLLAWTVGFDDDGFQHRIASDDGGDTWTVVPPASGFQGNINDVVYYDDTLLVGIPTDDPRAVPATGGG